MNSKISFLTWLTALLYACSGAPEEKKDTTAEVIAEKYDDGSTKILHKYPQGNEVNYYLRLLYYPNGQLASEGFMKDGKMTGNWKWYYDDGKPEAYSVFRDDKQTDSVLCFYRSGILSRSIYQLDTVDRLWFLTEYHENGKKKIETYLTGDSNLIDSSWKEWDENGKLLEMGKMDSTRKVGEWTVRNEKDSLVKVMMDGSETISYGE